MRCTTAARWVAGKTLETENATNGERPEELCTSSNNSKTTWQMIVTFRSSNLETIGQPMTSPTEKLYIIWKKEQSSIRPRGREEKRPHVPKNIGDWTQDSDDAKRFASEVGLR